ncbi:MAG: hypothetical protein IMZ69_00665, partial [Spirochaetes bacterium]|nr:hypothetical protein [Spirochaetota bacterium]
MRKFTVLVCGLALAMVASAEAAPITMLATQYTSSPLVTTVVLGGATVSAGPASDPSTKFLFRKEMGGFKALGVVPCANFVYPSTNCTDPSQGEIDAGEYINMTFGAQAIKEFTLGFMYQPGVYGDTVFEAAIVLANGTTGTSGRLTVTGNTLATWSFAGGTVVNISPATETPAMGGQFQ